LTHFRLLPGEEVRTPLVALQFWQGDWVVAQNVWRRWMIAHNLPRPGGHLPPPQLAGGSGRQTIEMQDANEGNQKEFLARVLKTGLKIDYWWMDAGWYPFKTAGGTRGPGIPIRIVFRTALRRYRKRRMPAGSRSSCGLSPSAWRPVRGYGEPSRVAHWSGRQGQTSLSRRCGGTRVAC
jgi:hypothetical protein